MFPNNAQTSVDPTSLPTNAVLNDLQAQVRIINEMQPRLSALTKLYQARKSRIDQFVEWYTDTPWWGKLLEGGLLVSTSYTLGAFVGVAWLLTALVTALYACAMSIMEEHAEMMKKRDTSFSEDIQSMEASIAASINSFRLLEDQLNTVFQSLNALQDKRSEGITSFEGKVDTMEEQNLRYASIIGALGNTAKKLAAHQGEVALTEVEIEMLAEELQNSLNEAKALCSVLSGVVSEVEQQVAKELQEEVTEAVEVQDSSSSVVEQADKAVSNFNQRLAKLRQARKVSQEGGVTHVNSGEGSVVSSLLHDLM